MDKIQDDLMSIMLSQFEKINSNFETKFNEMNDKFDSKLDGQNVKFDELKAQIKGTNEHLNRIDDIIEDTFNRLEPVSYTHLDVYKRQA